MHSTGARSLAIINAIDQLAEGLDLLKAAMMAAEALDSGARGPMTQLLTHAHRNVCAAHDSLNEAHEASQQEVNN